MINVKLKIQIECYEKYNELYMSKLKSATISNKFEIEILTSVLKRLHWG